MDTVAKEQKGRNGLVGGQRQGPKRPRSRRRPKTSPLVEQWRSSVGSYLFKGYDDTAAYFVQPLTEAEKWLRDEFDEWKKELRIKLHRKRDAQLQQSLAKRHLKADGTTEELRSRLFAAIVKEKRDAREHHIAKQKASPEFQRELALARGVAEDKAQVFHEIQATERGLKHESANLSMVAQQLEHRIAGMPTFNQRCEPFDECGDDLRGGFLSYFVRPFVELRAEAHELRTTATQHFSLAQEGKKKIMRSGDRWSDKVEKLFDMAAASKAKAAAVEEEIVSLLREQQNAKERAAAARETASRDRHTQVVEQISKYRSQRDVKAILTRADSSVFWDSRPVQLAACQALWFLSVPSTLRAEEVKANRDALISHGALKTLVRVLSQHADALDILEPWALGTITNLTATPHVASKIASERARGITYEDEMVERKYVAIQAMAVNDGVLEALLTLLKNNKCAADEDVVGSIVCAIRAVVGNSAANIRIAHDAG